MYEKAFLIQKYAAKLLMRLVAIGYHDSESVLVRTCISEYKRKYDHR